MITDAFSDLDKNAIERLVFLENTRQLNIESALGKTLKYLPEKVSEKEVDDDWRSRYFNKIQDISNDDLQEIWARILAGEIEEPGTVSLRTLDLLSNLSKYEAEKFQLACSMVSKQSHIYMIKSYELFDRLGLSYNDFKLLDEAGLIFLGNNAKYKLELKDNVGEMNIGDKIYRLTYSKANTIVSSYKFTATPLTTSGIELCKLINPITNENYRDHFCKLIESNFFKIELRG